MLPDALQASPLFAIGPSEPGPALRRSALVAMPVGLALLLELGLDSPTKGAIGTGALLAEFPGLDASLEPGGLTGRDRTTDRDRHSARRPHPRQRPLSVATMALVGTAAGYCFAVSLRFSIAGLSVALSLPITQDLSLDIRHLVRHLERRQAQHLEAVKSTARFQT